MRAVRYSVFALTVLVLSASRTGAAQDGASCSVETLAAEGARCVLCVRPIPGEVGTAGRMPACENPADIDGLERCCRTFDGPSSRFREVWCDRCPASATQDELVDLAESENERVAAGGPVVQQKQPAPSGDAPEGCDCRVASPRAPSPWWSMAIAGWVVAVGARSRRRAGRRRRLRERALSSLS